MIQGALEHLGVEFPLGIVGLTAEFVPKVCSGHQLRLEGTCSTGQARFLSPWSPLAPVTLQCWDRYCVLLIDDPMILGVELPLGVVGLGAIVEFL